MRYFAFCAALAAFFVSTETSAASPTEVRRLLDEMCVQNQENWPIPRLVETKKGSILIAIEHHTLCTIEFVARGNWYKFEYRASHVEARSAGVHEKEKSSLAVIALGVENADVQNLLPFQRFTIFDRKGVGKVVFGIHDTFNSKAADEEYFYLPAPENEEDDLCTAESCPPVGMEHGEYWQQFYAEAINLARTYLK